MDKQEEIDVDAIKKKLQKIGKDALIRADLKKVKDELLDQVLEETLDEIVKDTKLPFDDVIKSAIYPSLEKILKEKLDKIIDDMLK